MSLHVSRCSSTYSISILLACSLFLRPCFGCVQRTNNTIALKALVRTTFLSLAAQQWPYATIFVCDPDSRGCSLALKRQGLQDQALGAGRDGDFACDALHGELWYNLLTIAILVAEDSTLKVVIERIFRK